MLLYVLRETRVLSAPDGRILDTTEQWRMPADFNEEVSDIQGDFYNFIGIEVEDGGQFDPDIAQGFCSRLHFPDGNTATSTFEVFPIVDAIDDEHAPLLEALTDAHICRFASITHGEPAYEQIDALYCGCLEDGTHCLLDLNTLQWVHVQPADDKEPETHGENE